MTKLKHTYLFLIALFLSFSGFTQNILFVGHPKILHYNKLDFNANNQNWSCLQDNRGYMYFANSEGIVIFDGQSWTKIELPNTVAATCLTKDDSGRIYVGGENNIGYITCDSVGDFKFVNFPFILKRKFSDIWRLSFISPHYLAFFAQDSLFIYNLQNSKLKSVGLKNYYGLFTKINNHVTVFGPYKAGYIIPNGKQQLTKINLGNLISQKKHLIVNDLIEAFGDKIFLLRLDSMFLLDKNFNILKKSKAPVHSYTLSRAANDNYIFLNYPRKGLYVLDKNLNIIDLLDKKDGLSFNRNNDIFIDSYNNLWAASDNGIDYIIINSPLSYLDQLFEFDRTRNVCHYKHKFYFLSGFVVKFSPDSVLLNPLKSYKTTYVVKGSQGRNWNVTKLGQFYFLSHNPDILRIEGTQAKYLNLFRTNVWDIKQIPGTKKVLIGTNNGGYIANIHDTTLDSVHKVINGNLRYFILDKNQKLWANIIQDTAFYARIGFNKNFTKAKIEKIYTQKDGIESPYTLTTSYDRFNNLIITSDNKTIKYLDRSKDKFVPLTDITKHFQKKGDELYFIDVDSLGNYWINYVNVNNIKALKYRVYLFRHVKNKLVFEPYYTSSAVYRDYALRNFTYNKRFVFIPNTEGLVIFDYKHKIDTNKFRFNIYLEKIVSTKDNKIIWAGNTLSSSGLLTSVPPKNAQLPYKHNGLAFYIAAPFFENSHSIQFSFFLKGLDKNWTPWTTANYREYTFLREGKYTLQVKAKNIYGVQSPILSYNFAILPPWYRSTLAYIVYALLFFSAIIIGIRLYTYNLRKRNEKLEKLVHERTKEIEMKNVELEQQKEEIQTQAEELADVNQQLQKLSLIAERTDNAVLLTDKDGNFIWVNPGFTRIFGYTLEELKTFISPNIISQRTPEDIKKLIHKSLKERETVEYEAEFTTKDRRNIWVHTTLTPVLDENNEVVNLIVIDSDVTKIKDAEQKIRVQNESIKGSIRYAQAILSSILPLQEEFEQFFETFILFKPRDIVSGDFYWISPLFKNGNTSQQCQFKHPKLKDGDYLFISVIDCTGHGVPGAFMSIIGNRLLDNIINQRKIHNPAAIFEEMDQNLAEIFKHIEESHRDGMSGTLCRLDHICQDQRPVVKVTLTGAKANIFVYKKKTNKLTLIKGVRRTIGQRFIRNVKFENQTFYLEKDDIIFLFTDGYKDQNNKERIRLGIKKFKNILLQNIDLPMKEIGKTLETELNKWMEGTEQRDDITVLGIKIKDL